MLEAPGRPEIEVTTPRRHGPPLSHPLAGDVVGFVLLWEGQEDGVLSNLYKRPGRLGSRQVVTTW